MGKDASEIRREIEQTRARMGDTVEALAYKSDVPARVRDSVDDTVATVKGTIGDAVGSVKDTLTGATGKVGTALGGAKRVVGESWNDTTGRMGDATSAIGDNLPSSSDMKRVARRGMGIVRENPLGVGLGALAIGLLAGLVVPVTDYEREKVGPLRDDLVEKAQALGLDALEHGKQVVQDSARAALQSAPPSAQTPG